jgi:hypothetical protein
MRFSFPLQAIVRWVNQVDPNPRISMTAKREMVKVAAVSSEAMHAQNCAISSQRSPIGKGDAVKAPPRQPAN